MLGRMPSRTTSKTNAIKSWKTSTLWPSNEVPPFYWCKTLVLWLKAWLWYVYYLSIRNDIGLTYFYCRSCMACTDQVFRSRWPSPSSLFSIWCVKVSSDCPSLSYWARCTSLPLDVSKNSSSILTSFPCLNLKQLSLAFTSIMQLSSGVLQLLLHWRIWHLRYVKIIDTWSDTCHFMTLY